MKNLCLFASIVFFSSITFAQSPLQSSISPPSTPLTPNSSTNPVVHPQEPSTSKEVTQPVGKGSGLWEWTPYAKYHDTIVEVSTEHGSGTGVLIRVNKSKEN